VMEPDDDGHGDALRGGSVRIAASNNHANSAPSKGIRRPMAA
jgi:hypothetical protein